MGVTSLTGSWKIPPNYSLILQMEFSKTFLTFIWLGEDDSRFDRIIRSAGEVYDEVPLNRDHEEEDRFSRILRQNPTYPEVSRKHLDDPEELRISMSRTVCSYLPEIPYCRGHRLLGVPKFFRVVRRAKTNGQEEVRFQRILREDQDSEPSEFEEMVWEEEDNPGGLDLDKSRFYRRLREERDQRATQGAWSPMGKRSKVNST